MCLCSIVSTVSVPLVFMMCLLVKVLCHFVLHTPALFEVLRPTGDAVRVLPTHHAMRCHGHACSLACHVTVTVSYIVQNYVLQSCFTHFLLKTPARVAPTAIPIIYAMYVQYIVRHVFSDYCLGCPSHCHRAQSNLCQEPQSCSIILPVVAFPEPAPLRCTHWPTWIPHHLIHTEHGQPNSVGCLGKSLCGESACPSSIPCIC